MDRWSCSLGAFKSESHCLHSELQPADNWLGEGTSTLGSLAFNSIGFGFRQNWSIQKSSGTWQAAVVGWAWAEELALGLSALLLADSATVWPSSIVEKSSTMESNCGNNTVYQACDMFEKFQIAVHIIRKQPVVMLPLLLELMGSQGGARMPIFNFAFPGRRGWDLAKLPKSTVKTPCWVHDACFWPAAGRTYTNLDEAICYFHGRKCYRRLQDCLSGICMWAE